MEFNKYKGKIICREWEQKYPIFLTFLVIIRWNFFNGFMVRIIQRKVNINLFSFSFFKESYFNKINFSRIEYGLLRVYNMIQILDCTLASCDLIAWSHSCEGRRVLSPSVHPPELYSSWKSFLSHCWMIYLARIWNNKKFHLDYFW